MKEKCDWCRKLYTPNSKTQIYCSSKCNDLSYYYKHKQEKKAYQRKYYYKNFERDKEKRQLKIKKWYKKNKEKQNQNTKKDYFKNKKKWYERKWVDRHKDKLLKILPKKCENCGKRKVQVIHHKEYGKTPRLERTGKGAKDWNRPQLEKYAKKYLLGFCSKTCHRNYERKNNGVTLK